MPFDRHRSVRRRRFAPVAALALAAMLALPTIAPPPVQAATTTMVPACEGVNLRTGTSTSNAVRVRLGTGATVTVNATVSGSSWSTVCAGQRSGSTWHRISHVNGQTVSSLYGITHLFAATGVLVPANAATTPARTPPPTTTETPDILGAELMRLVNLDRVALGRPALLVDAGLAAIARDAPFTCPTDPSLVIRGRAADMAQRSYFSHSVAGCFAAGTTTPVRALDIVRQVFGYTQARSEILAWNVSSTAPTNYQVGCDIRGANCTGGTTTTPQTVAIAQRSFLGSTPHRTSQLGTSQRFGCGTATVPGTRKTYFACLFSHSGSTIFNPDPIAAPSPAPAPTPTPAPAPTPTPAPAPTPTPAPSPTPPPVQAATTTMVPACEGVNLRTGTSTSNAVKVRLGTGATVTVNATVNGSSWSTVCAGQRSGSTWHRISHVNGQTVRSLYGVTHLFAATGVLVPAAGTSPSPGPAPAPPAPSPTPAPGSPAAVPAGATILPASVTLHGRGWGHGVGMSQWGARGRALAGQDAATILAHFYRGTTLGVFPTDAEIRVLLLDDIAPTSANPLVVIGRSGGWTIGGVAATFPADARLRLIPTTSGSTAAWRLVVDDSAGNTLLDAAAPGNLVLTGTSEATLLQLPANSATFDLFRGRLRIIVAGATLDVVNELPLESYLRGVVPAEMPSTWPAAALEAQTIAARSYAARRIRPGVGTFDVHDDTRHQVYLGVRRESSAVDLVIAATAGQVLRSGTVVANTLYHSTAGGVTEHNENVFVSDAGARIAAPVAHLRGAPDRDPAGVPYDADSPFASWATASYTVAQLSAIFAADSRTDVGALAALDLRNRGVSGRLISVTLFGTGGTKTVSGRLFIAIFNANRPSGDPSARSTLLDLAPIP